MRKAEFVIEIDEKRCKGCAICVAVCPQECLAIQDQYNPAGYFYPATKPEAKCSGCGACVKLCPDYAITVYELSAAPADAKSAEGIV